MTRWKGPILLAAGGLACLALWLASGAPNEDPMPRSESRTYQAEGRRMHYVSAGDRSHPLVLLVHGSPGDWTAFEEYLDHVELLQEAWMLAVDRPGFGSSGFGRPEPSLEVQARLLRPLLEKADARGAVLVGHSLGGSVIARMAMDFPARVAGLLLVAPAIDPQLEKLRWYNRLASLSAVRLLLPRALDTSNLEILPLRSELEKMLPLWPRVEAPTIVIHGSKDRLVPAANADFAGRALVNAPVDVRRVHDAGHFILWERPDLVVQAILELVRGAGDAPTP